MCLRGDRKCHSRLLIIWDELSGRSFLCDAGAQSSVLPTLKVNSLANGHGLPMEAANGTPIHTYELCFGGQKFGWDFITANVGFPLLGADFLCAYGLLVDMKNCCLIDAVTFCSYACTHSDS